MKNPIARFFSQQKILTTFYLYSFVFQALILSIVPVMTAANYSTGRRVTVLFLEFWFFIKAVVSIVLRKAWQEERFLGYTMRFPNYLEFAFLFIEIFGIQEYRLRTQKKRPRIIDCGSGWGMSILYFKHCYPNASILAVEANTDIVPLFRGNLIRNGIGDVTIKTSFVCGREGQHPFYRYDAFDGWSISNTGAVDCVGTNADFKKTTVPSRSLASLLRHGADAVKLDIEGMEGEAIMSARKELESVREVLIEHHPGMNSAHNAFRDILRILKSAGFYVTYVNTKTFVLRKNALRTIYARRT